MAPLSPMSAGGEHYAPLEFEGHDDDLVFAAEDDDDDDAPFPPPDLKGKGRYLGSEEETGQETQEEGNDSEAEEKGLLAPQGHVAATPHPDSDAPRRTSLPPFQGNNGVFSRLAASFANAVGGRTHQTFALEMISQTFPILLLSLMGSLLTGMLLGKLQEWRVFIRIEELFILVPILLNLKGNLEMNLAARFSTSANIGELDLRATRRSLIFGNLALLQVQALLVSLFSGLLAFVLGLLSRNGVHHGLQHPLHNPGKAPNVAAGGTVITDGLRGGYFEALLVLCVSMLAASLSSAVLGSFMCSTVVLCRRFKINPDNIATPLAAVLGDLLTLTILGVLSSLFAKFMGTLISTAVFLVLLVSVLVNVVITFRNAYVQELLSVGWGPLFIAMIISSATGLVLEAYVNEFEGFALFAQVLTALVGNAGSIFVSRISTALHSSRKEHYVIVGVTLFCITCPVLFLFLLFVWITGQAPVTFAFALAFVGVIVIELLLSLSLGYYLALFLWEKDFDPDVYALPLLTSLLDVAGQLLLVGAFTFARWFSKDALESALPVVAGQTAGGL